MSHFGGFQAGVCNTPDAPTLITARFLMQKDHQDVLFFEARRIEELQPIPLQTATLAPQFPSRPAFTHGELQSLTSQPEEQVSGRRCDGDKIVGPVTGNIVCRRRRPIGRR